MDDYDLIKKSSLKFKGEKKKKKKRSEIKSVLSTTHTTPEHRSEKLDDAEAHGGWWEISKLDHIRDSVAIEFLPGCYARALSNGRIVLGDLHPPGDGPDEEEIFTVLRTGVDRVALKSGYGRFLTVDNKNRIKGLSETVGELETFTPVFEDGKVAICAQNEYFLSPDENSESHMLVARADKVGPNEVLKIRVNYDPSNLDRRRKEYEEPRAM